jgi:crossover junction endodeoxyribonuclease RuvC
MRLIGLDPGLRNTGWGVIESEGNRLSFVACGVVSSSDKDSLAERLRTLYYGISQVIDEFSPLEAAVENTFVNKDAVATLKLGQARGIALLVPVLKGLSVAEYEPNKVKKSVVGAGHADKTQVQTMVKLLLPKADFKQADAADALAIAITHAHYRGVRKLS